MYVNHFFFIQTLVKDARRPQKRVLRMVIRLFKIMICFNRCCTWEKDQKLIFGSSISVSKKKEVILSLQAKTYLSYYIIEGNQKHDISKLKARVELNFFPSDHNQITIMNGT